LFELFLKKPVVPDGFINDDLWRPLIDYEPLLASPDFFQAFQLYRVSTLCFKRVIGNKIRHPLCIQPIKTYPRLCVETGGKDFYTCTVSKTAKQLIQRRYSWLIVRGAFLVVLNSKDKNVVRPQEVLYTYLNLCPCEILDHR